VQAVRALRLPVGKVRFHVSGRLVLFITLMAGAGILLAAGAMLVPIKAPLLPASERFRYLWVLITAAAFVLVVATGWILAMRVWWRRHPAALDAQAPEPALALDDRHGLRGHLAPLAVLRPELVPGRLIVITALTALGMVIGAAVLALPPYAIVSAALIPWIPMFFVEGVRKYQHYGMYALFGATALLQLGHLGEHTVQVIQVFVFSGDLARAHGIFGQLDFETVHFFWDGLVWIALGALLLRFGTTNRWLWVAFIAASVHEVEHIYLMFVYKADYTFYLNGGYEGVMGYGGVIGSPFFRPYLHFAYNVCVIVPLLFAFWDQTVRVYRSSHHATAVAAATSPTGAI
jgi:hypothetical protein